jgi:hypothetical protein
MLPLRLGKPHQQTFQGPFFGLRQLNISHVLSADGFDL